MAEGKRRRISWKGLKRKIAERKRRMVSEGRKAWKHLGGRKTAKKEDMKAIAEGKKPMQETEFRPCGNPFESSSTYEHGESSAAAAMQCGAGGGGGDVDAPQPRVADYPAAATNIKKKTTLKKRVLQPFKIAEGFLKEKVLGKGKKESRHGKSHSSASASGSGSQSQGQQSQSASSASASQRAHVPPPGGRRLNPSSASASGSGSQRQGQQSQSASAAQRAHVPPSGGHRLSTSSPKEGKSTN
ncbi:uncharacterized protein LOC112490501 [Ziziphus jujuba]|uniref:Uncharacterized protein LOC112490501 n=2 Tax=Ziziphus jujuba TaxID=326968 RepID=A0A6P6FXE0_ZIZJJ|nr:uncharacterized protein LOC112490501 [Ziziphus jujuba]KAH7541919.1 hypothetical protein FEM48_Zijuj02G0018500 [Ziziphus jujuba var. spinosa]